MTKREQGFGIVEIILILVVVALVGVGGWYVWQSQNNKTVTSTQNTASTDMYADWKSHCDDTSKACFKYPADWSLTQSDENGLYAVHVVNPAKTVVIDYLRIDTRDGANQSYYTALVNDLSTPDARFKAEGGFVTGVQNALPHIRIVDAKIITDYAVKAGETSQFTDTARFTQTSGDTASFMATPVGTVFTEQTAKDWFATADATTAKLIIESFYLY